jgi:hypothetical protein
MELPVPPFVLELSGAFSSCPSSIRSYSSTPGLGLAAPSGGRGPRIAQVPSQVYASVRHYSPAIFLALSTFALENIRPPY